MKNKALDPDTVEDTQEEQKGWKDKLIRVLTDALHDRVHYGTKVRKTAMMEAMDEPEETEEGFKKLKK